MLLKVLHNEVSEEIEFNGSNLKELTVLLLDYVNRQQRVIENIYINNKSVSSGLGDDYTISATDSIEVVSLEPVQMTLKSIEEILSQFPNFREKIDNIVNLMVEGSREKSFNEFNSLLLNINDIIKFLQTLEQLFGIDFETLMIDENRTSLEFINSLTEKLVEIREAMKNEDQVTLSDLLEYEIKDVFAEEKEFAGLLTAISSLLKNE